MPFFKVNKSKNEKRPVSSTSNSLLPTTEIIVQAANAGADLGLGNPNERIRYFIKLGLLPHTTKILSNTSQTLVGHLPAWTVERLVEITALNKKGLTFPQIANKLKNTNTPNPIKPEPIESLRSTGSPTENIRATGSTQNPAIIVKLAESSHEKHLSKKLASHEENLKKFVEAKFKEQSQVVSNFDLGTNSTSGKTFRIPMAALAAIVIFSLISSTVFIGSKKLGLSLGTSTSTKTQEVTSNIAKSGQVLAATSEDHRLYIDANMEVTGTSLFQEDITAPNVVYSVTGGTGINVTAGQNPTVSLDSTAFVTSVNNAGGAITLAGSGSTTVTESNGTITISSSSGTSGDITGVSAGNGLTGGGSSGDVSLAVSLTTSGTSTTTSSASGLEFSSGLSLLRGCSDSETLAWESTTSTWDCSAAGGGGFTSFDVSGDSGTDQTITNTNILEIAGGTNGIDTVAGATDTVTINLDTTEIGTTTFGSGSGIVWTFDAGATDPTITFGSGTIAFSGTFSATNFSGTSSGTNTGDQTTISGNAGTATALAANGANCSAGSAPLGVDASGAVESCTDYEEDLANSAGLAAALSDETGSAGGGVAVFSNAPSITSPTITTSPTAAGATWTDLGTVTTADINGGTIDGTVIGGASAAAGSFTTITASSTATFNGNTVIGNANSDTLTINAGTSGTGITFADATFATCTALETVSGVLTCGSDGTGGTASALAWDDLTAPDANLALSMAAFNTAFTWDPTANAAETAFTLNFDGEDSTGGGDEDQVLLALNQSSNGTDVDEAADALLTLTNSDANDPVNSGIRFDAGAAGTDFTYGINFSLANIGTAEIVLENGEAIHGQSADTITFEDDDGTDYATLTASALTVTGDLAITGGNVTTATTFDQTLDVTGITTLTGNLNANGGFDVDDAFVVADGGVLTTSQTANFDGTADFDGNVLISDTDIAFDGATTTFTTTGDLTITSGGGDIIVSNAGTINIGGSGSDVAYNAIGDSLAGAASVNSDNDLYIEDDLEVDGTIFGALTGNVTGSATDLSCTDCINATEIEDIYLLNSGDSTTGTITFDGVATDVTTGANEAFTIAPNGSGDVVIDTDSDTQLTLNGGGDGVDSLVLTDGDILVSDGDFDLSGGDFNITLDTGDSAAFSAASNTTAANGAFDFTVSSNTTNNRGIDLAYTTTATTGVTLYGTYGSFASTTGLDADVAPTYYGIYQTVTKSGTDGTDTNNSDDNTLIYGIASITSNTSATASGDTNNHRHTFSGYFSATGNAGGTDTTSAYGIYSTASGADTNYALYTPAGNVGMVLGAGEKVLIDGPSNSGTAGVMDVNITSGTNNHRGVDISYTGSSSGGVTQYGVYNNFTQTGSPSGAGSTLNQYGIYSRASNNATTVFLDTSGVLNMYGITSIASQTATDSGSASTRTTYGGYFSSTGSSDGTSLALGLYVDATGADTNTAIYATGTTFAAIAAGIVSITNDADGDGFLQVVSAVDQTNCLSGTSCYDFIINTSITDVAASNDAWHGQRIQQTVNASGGTLTNRYGLSIGTPTLTSGSVTNNYGIYLDNHSNGGTLNYALYSAGGNVNTLLNAANTFLIDGSTTASTLSSAGTGVLDVNVTSLTPGNSGINLTYTGTATGSATSTQYGIYGNLTSSTASTGGNNNLSYYGMYGISTKSGADSTYSGTQSLYGVFGSANNSSSGASATRYSFGGYFDSGSGGSGTHRSFGAYGISAGTGGASYGLFGTATGAASINYGLWGTASGGSANYGIFTDTTAAFDADLRFIGAQTITTSAGALTIDAASDVDISPAGDVLLTQGDDILATFVAGGQITLNATSTPNTTTTGVIDLNVTSLTHQNNGFNLSYTSTAAGADTTVTQYGMFSSFENSQAFTATSPTVNWYGLYNNVAKSGSDVITTSGTFNTYGSYNLASNTATDVDATRSTFGGYFGATGAASGTTATYGIYTAASGADNNYGIFVSSAEPTGIHIVPPTTLSTYSINGIRAIGTITKDGSESYLGFLYDPTINISNNGDGFSEDNAVTSTPTLSFSSGLTYAGIESSFRSNPTYTTAGAAGTTISNSSGFTSRITTSSTGAGSLTISNFSGFLVDGDLLFSGIGASTTISNLSGLRVENTNNSGTLTSQYGVYIENLTNGTNDYGVYVAGADTYGLWVDSGTTRLDGVLIANLSDGTSSTEAVCGTVASENSAASTIDDCTTSVNADYAEIYPTEQGVDYGDVLVASDTYLDLEHFAVGSNSQIKSLGEQKLPRLKKSQTAYESQVIGIVSENYSDFSSTGAHSVPAEHNPKPIALAGRVPVKVSTENGPINKGDLLTTSSTPGVAMKATKTSRTFAMAFADYNAEDPNQISQIMVLVENGWYMGALAANGTLTVGEIAPDSDIDQSVQIADLTVDEFGVLVDGGALDGQILTADQVQKLVEYEVDKKVDALIASGNFASPGTQNINSPVPDEEASSSAEATDSAQLAQETQDSWGTLNQLLSTTNLELDTLTVTGSTNLAQTQVAGTFSQDGTFVIDYGRQINVMANTLFLQNDPYAGNENGILLDVGNGKLTFDKTGKLNIGSLVADNLTTKEITVDTSSANAKSAGTATLASGSTQTTIFTTLVKPNAKILITPTTPTGGKQLYVATKSEYEGFTVRIDGSAATGTIQFDWIIVNTNSISQAN